MDAVHGNSFSDLLTHLLDIEGPSEVPELNDHVPFIIDRDKELLLVLVGILVNKVSKNVIALSALLVGVQFGLLD
jgi:hypothetical protein